jgi:hypothetical protein
MSDIQVKRIPMKNRIVVMNGCALIDVSTKSHPHVFALIDSEDAVAVMAHRWSATKRANGLYVRGTVNGKSILLHRFIMDPPAHLTVDHEDGNPLNNRRGNLRICTQSENIIHGADRRRGGPKPMATQRSKMTTVEEWRAYRERLREKQMGIKERTKHKSTAGFQKSATTGKVL